MSCNNLTNFEYEEAFAKPKLLKFGKKTSLPQGCTKGQKSGGAGSNAARRRCPAAPSDLPKSGGAAAPPAPPLVACLHKFLFKFFRETISTVV